MAPRAPSAERRAAALRPFLRTAAAGRLRVVVDRRGRRRSHPSARWPLRQLVLVVEAAPVRRVVARPRVADDADVGELQVHRRRRRRRGRLRLLLTLLLFCGLLLLGRLLLLFRFLLLFRLLVLRFLLLCLLLFWRLDDGDVLDDVAGLASQYLGQLLGVEGTDDGDLVLRVFVINLLDVLLG